MDVNDNDAFFMTTKDHLESFTTLEYAPCVWTEEVKIDNWEADMDEEVVYSLDDRLESVKQEDWMLGHFWIQTLMHMLLAVAT